MTTTEKFSAYCLRCREKREADGTPGETKKGQPVLRGSCPTCGGTMMRFLKRLPVAE